MSAELIKYMLDGILLSLLLGIAGLLVWFHARLNKLVESYGEMPQLSEIFGENISEAKSGIQSLSDQVSTQVLEAGKTLQEINYVLDRAEKVMSQFDERLDEAKSRGMQKTNPAPTQQKKQAMTPPFSAKQAVLPQDVVPKVRKQEATTPRIENNKSVIEESLAGRALGGMTKKIKKFRPREAGKGEGVVFKNTSPASSVGAYGAAAAIQKSGGGQHLAAEQEEGLIRALKERL
jgi:hypothetical protein